MIPFEIGLDPLISSACNVSWLSWLFPGGDADGALTFPYRGSTFDLAHHADTWYGPRGAWGAAKMEGLDSPLSLFFSCHVMAEDFPTLPRYSVRFNCSPVRRCPAW